jgi:lipid II isoglutaminyl synthase (glutamine-hydrolysing)
MLAPKLAIARAVGVVSRLRGGGGTSLPGRLLLALDPGAIAELSARLPDGCAVVSATNGKTTTAALAASILEREGVSLVHNQAGANMAGGVASTLLGAARGRGVAGDFGLFEVDEFWLPKLVEQLRPRVVVLGNLFRDQLDRYGELDAIADRWERAVRGGAGSGALLVCNADDPTVADLARGRGGGGEDVRGGGGREWGNAGVRGGEGREQGERGGGGGGIRGDGGEGGVIFYGVQDDSLALRGVGEAADAKHCRRCGAPYAFEVVYLGHLGRYHCPSCGQRRPSPTVLAREVTLEGVRGARFRLRTPAGEADVRIALPGLYNVYNALAAAALGVALGVGLAAIVEGLESTAAAFGRGESVAVGGRPTRIMLVKNPAGATEVLRTLALEPGVHDLLGVLNDNAADGRDVSWIWDADFEALAGRVRVVTCSGTRAPELALRLKYAGVPPERIGVVEDLPAALAHAARERPEGDPAAPLYALPTYTAMLALREELVRRGEAGSSWG